MSVTAHVITFTAGCLRAVSRALGVDGQEDVRDLPAATRDGHTSGVARIAEDRGPRDEGPVHQAICHLGRADGASNCARVLCTFY